MTTTPTTQVIDWSPESLAIFGWFETPSDTFRNLVVRARAGCGKTTAIIEGVKRASEKAVLVCAFSKIIEQELTKRIGSNHPNVTAKTLHALGYACVRMFREKLRVDNGARETALVEAVCGKSAPDAVKKLVGKLTTVGREGAPHATKLGELTALQIEFECEPDEQWELAGFGAEYVERKALEAMELASNVKTGGTIDYADMLFLPVRNGWLTKKYDLVVVDEAQDMTITQLEIALGVLKTNGRVAIVGDDKQAIFGFRGADSDSLDRLKTQLNATELGLKKTFRCGKAIVALAATLVPDFEAAPSNHDGLVSHLAKAKLVAAAGPGDFILSRVNAPLVSIAMQLLRAGKRTRVAGRNIGAGLQALVKKLNARSVPEFLTKIEAWVAKETSRLDAQLKTAKNGRVAALNAKIEQVIDQADMLVSLTDGAKNISEIVDRVDALFSDDNGIGMITCSSVHRAKGLEANRVFVLADTLRNDSQEELNIAYVAYTRAKTELVLVTKNTPADVVTKTEEN